MSDNSVFYDPTNGQWSLSDGEHFLTVPHWARLSIADAYEREVEPLKAENAALFALLEHESEQLLELRELVASVWRLFAEHGAVNPCDLPEVDAVRDRMRELGVDDGD